jgi:hypothetical protein
MTTEADDGAGDGRCSIPGCRGRTDGRLLCTAHRARSAPRIAVEMLPHLQCEAKKRQATSTGGESPQLVPKSAEAGGSARDIAAKAVGVGHSIAPADRKADTFTERTRTTNDRR